MCVSQKLILLLCTKTHDNIIMHDKWRRMQSVTILRAHTQTHTHVPVWSKQHAPINTFLIGAQQTPHSLSRTPQNHGNLWNRRIKEQTSLNKEVIGLTPRPLVPYIRNASNQTQLLRDTPTLLTSVLVAWNTHTHLMYTATHKDASLLSALRSSLIRHQLARDVQLMGRWSGFQRTWTQRTHTQACADKH